MEIKAKVNLKLSSTIYKVILRYDTYQKATYDSYLIASLRKNAKNEKEANDYIDDISGQGSLNGHFKRLYKEISNFSDAQIDGILKNSLYPVTMVVSERFSYYSALEASKYKGHVFKGNLFDDKEALKNSMMPKDSNSTFLDISFEKIGDEEKTDVYDAVFSETTIKVNLGDNTYLPITKSAFDKAYDGQSLDISKYRGEITDTITDGNWNVLTQNSFDAISRDKHIFFDRDGNANSISDSGEYIKTTSIIKVFGIYFYKETRYDATKNNSERCIAAVEMLLVRGWIDEYKTKSLVRLLVVVPDEWAQKAINYTLNRKNSKEVADVGLSLINKGLEKGWTEEALRSMKKFVTPSTINGLYRADDTLLYTIDDLLLIDKNILSERHAKQVKEYTETRENLIAQMDSMIGKIMNSGIREKMKSLKTKDSVYKQLNDAINSKSTHLRLKKDYSDMNLDQLTTAYNSIKVIYEGPFQKIKERLEKEENKA